MSYYRVFSALSASLILAFVLNGCVTTETNHTGEELSATQHDGPNTDSSVENPTQQERTQLSPSGNPLVAAVQQNLKGKGYNPGKADGILGKKTKNAIKNLEKDNNLLLTGNITSDVLEILAIDQKLIEQNPAILFTATAASPKIGNTLNSNPQTQTASTSQDTYLMRGPSIMAESLVQIPAGSNLTVLDKISSFYKVLYRGQQGFIYQGSVYLIEK